MIDLIIGAIVIWIVFRLLDKVVNRNTGPNYIIKDEDGQFWVLKEKNDAIKPETATPVYKGKPKLRVVK